MCADPVDTEQAQDGALQGSPGWIRILPLAGEV